MSETRKVPRPAIGSVTLAHVAALAGVSTSAVSRTFTPGASVAKKTRARVLEAAKDLGYRPNAIARTLSTRKSRIIGLVVSYLHNQFYPTVIEQLSQRLQARGYHVLLFISDDHSGADAETDTLVLEILQYQVDGLVLASTMMSSRLALHCQALGIPVVMLNRVALVEQASAVTSDNYEGGRLAAQFLVKQGATRIGFIGGLKDASTTQEREQGFVDELTRQGKILYAHASGDYDFDVARRAAHALFVSNKGPDAIFVANDHMAFAVLDALRNDLGLQVPQDVQVIGFDNVPQAAWGAYQLTTIEQNSEEMVKSTVTILLEHIESGTATPQRVVIPVKLVPRATTLKDCV